MYARPLTPLLRSRINIARGEVLGYIPIEWLPIAMKLAHVMPIKYLME